MNNCHCQSTQARNACVNLHSTGRVYRVLDEEKKSQLTPCHITKLIANRKALAARKAGPVRCAIRHQTPPPTLQHTPHPPTLSYQVAQAPCLPLHQVSTRITAQATKGGSARLPQPGLPRGKVSNSPSLQQQEDTRALDNRSDLCHRLPIRLLLRLY